MSESAGRFNRLRGKFRIDGIEFIDHGDAVVDEMWRERLQAEAILAAMCPPEVEYDVPPEYVNAGRVPDTWFDCIDILMATDDPEILSD